MLPGCAQEKLRSDSAALAANEQDRAEAAQVFRDMQTLRVVVTSTDYAVPKRANGREQNGSRFALVVQSDSLALFIWLVAPTSTSAMAAGFRPEIDVFGRRTRLRRLAPRIGSQSPSDSAARLAEGTVRQPDPAQARLAARDHLEAAPDAIRLIHRRSGGCR